MTDITHPGTMVIEFQDTDSTHAAVMCPVRFDQLAPIAESNGSRVRSIHDRKVLRHYIEDLFLLLFTRRLGQFLQVGQWDAELKRVWNHIHVNTIRARLSIADSDNNNK